MSMCNLLFIDYLKIGPPNYYFLGLAILSFMWFVLLCLGDRPDKDFFDKCDALEIKIKENNMLGKAPPSNVYTVEMLVTVECKAYNKSDARTKAFDIVNFASQENDEHVSISSISIGKVTDNNVEYEELG